MKFYIVTLFPQLFEPVLKESILGRAQGQKKFSYHLINPRDFTLDKRKTVDDKPYGGGAGMVMMVEPLVKAIESIKPKPYSILLSASGRKYDQKTAANLAQKKSVALICGHYEGIDQRVEDYVDETVSIGDFVLTGGEIAALALIDSTVRLLPGVINKDSLQSESFSQPSTIDSQLSTYLEYPQYTRPDNFRGHKVPKILLSGNHEEISKWRKQEAAKRLKKLRPDLSKKI